MLKTTVAITRYKKPGESVRKAVEQAGGLGKLPRTAKVFVKPNIVLWNDLRPFPKWGMITTSRVVEDMVALLKDQGIRDIAIGEGPVLLDQRDKDVALRAFQGLGYESLKKRYSVKLVNVHRSSFQAVDLGDGIKIELSRDFLERDFVVNLPVMKTHSQTVVSLGIKNLKGVIAINARKKCHAADPVKDLHFRVARLANCLPSSFTLLDGIYTNECGPGFDGKMRRSDLLVASQDVLSADKVGARLLGYDPTDVPHLVHAAANARRPADLSDVELRGANIEDVALKLRHTFEYNQDGTLPLFMARRGIAGLSFRKPDTTLCTYCFTMAGLILGSIAMSWKGVSWDDVEVLTGKVMKPTPGKNWTILIGKCMYQANKDNPDIRHLVAIKGCPPSGEGVVKALHEAGIQVDPDLIVHPERAPRLMSRKYEGKPEFDEGLFTVAEPRDSDVAS